MSCGNSMMHYSRREYDEVFGGPQDEYEDGDVACPKCGSGRVKPKRDKETREEYWRCMNCGGNFDQEDLKDESEKDS